VTHEGCNYLKAAKKIDCTVSYTEVNGEAMVKIYSLGRAVVRLSA
jgi:hypothetical protein